MPAGQGRGGAVPGCHTWLCPLSGDRVFAHLRSWIFKQVMDNWEMVMDSWEMVMDSWEMSGLEV